MDAKAIFATTLRTSSDTENRKVNLNVASYTTSSGIGNSVVFSPLA
jgi:hypothetical protein